MRFPRPEMLVPSKTKDRISVTAFFVFNWHLTKEVAGLVRKNKKKKYTFSSHITLCLGFEMMILLKEEW
jgi:hypothetical protein